MALKHPHLLYIALCCPNSGLWQPTERMFVALSTLFMTCLRVAAGGEGVHSLPLPLPISSPCPLYLQSANNCVTIASSGCFFRPSFRDTMKGSGRAPALPDRPWTAPGRRGVMVTGETCHLFTPQFATGVMIMMVRRDRQTDL